MRGGLSKSVISGGTRTTTAGSRAFLTPTVDAALVMQTFILAAETAGLGCCPISALRNHADAVARILELPEKVFPVAGLCIGYPAAEGFVSMRLPLAVTVHDRPLRRQPSCRRCCGLRPAPRQPAIRRRASSSAPRISSAMPISTDGPKINRARPRPSPKGKASRPTFARAALLSIRAAEAPAFRKKWGDRRQLR